MGKHLVLAGGGHAHMVTMANIHVLRHLGHRVTVIGPSAYHYYSGMGPGMLGSGYEPDDIRFATRKKVEEQGGIFVLDSIVGIDPGARALRLQSGNQMNYDVVSFNTGSHVDIPVIEGSRERIYTVKPIERLYQARTEIESLAKKQSVTVAVVGGGPAGTEAAGNVAQLLSRSPFPAQVTLFAGRSLLARFPPGVRNKSRRILERSGVSIQEQGHLLGIHDNRMSFDSGSEVEADFIILATGVHPSPFFREAGLQTGPDGGLLVNRFLQHPDYLEMFGGGDCIWYKEQPLDKVGVYAVRENPVLFHNLKAFLQGESLQAFDPGGDYLLIFNLGNRQGVLRKKWFQLTGRIAFWVKDWIDKKFMKEFQ
ncbi:MAG: FAD-dependent oxidoreductase [Proteobacteria bacterium]|nr:FAD-dependent oxidoreductase [Pseudomonadota bacterium]MBU1059619.1 FAD-dependent oxidoreductase [Pseudomonadota bacterium]